MSTKARIVLTVAVGIVMAVCTWLKGDWSTDVLFASAVLLPLIVGRWWVVAALAGPFIVLVILELTGYAYGDGSVSPNSVLFWGIFALVFAQFLMLILVAIRKAFDFLRSRGVTAVHRHRARVASGADS